MGALCLFLSAMEHLIPKPLPFMRIGLANFPLLLSLQFFSARNFFLLAFVKVVGQALVTGTLFSYVVLFSLTGTALSAITMLLLYRKASLAGTSIAGAFVSNAAQLALARFILFGEGILYLAPPFLAAGIISGALLGFFAMNFSAKSEWLKSKQENIHGFYKLDGLKDGENAGKSEDHSNSPSVSAFMQTTFRSEKLLKKALWNGCLVFLLVVFLFVPRLPVRAVLFLLFWIMAIAAKRKTRPLFTIISIITITLCNCFPPFGKILWEAGPFVLAEGSLFLGLQRAVTMSGLIMFSRLALLSMPQLPGKFGTLLQECFVILEKMNSIFFGGEKVTPGLKTEKTTGGLVEKLDRLLIEVSGAK